MDFQGIYIVQDKDRAIMLSQDSYASKMTLKELSLDKITKLESSRLLSKQEMKFLQSDSCQLAWLAAWTLTSSAFEASMSLACGKGNPPAISTLKSTRRTLDHIQEMNLAQLTYKQLNLATTHIRVYPDGVLQH